MHFRHIHLTELVNPIPRSNDFTAVVISRQQPLTNSSIGCPDQLSGYTHSIWLTQFLENIWFYGSEEQGARKDLL